MSLEDYLRLIRDCCPNIEVRSVTPITEGWDSFVLDVNGEYIFRFPRFAETEANYEREGRLLAVLAPFLSVEVPRFEFDCRVEGQEFSRFVGYRKIIGEPLSRERLAHPSGQQMARHLAAVLPEMHSFRVERAVKALVPVYEPAQWQQRYSKLYQDIQERVMSRLGVHARVYTEKIWEDYLSDDACFDFEPALIHCDLGSEHILCDHERRRVIGIIDWTDACVGDPAIDFVGILVECGREFTEKVVAEYSNSVSESFWKRVEFYRAAGPYHAIIYGLDTGQEGFVRSGIETVTRRAVAEPGML